MPATGAKAAPAHSKQTRPGSLLNLLQQVCTGHLPGAAGAGRDRQMNAVVLRLQVWGWAWGRWAEGGDAPRKLVRPSAGKQTRGER